MTVILPTGMKRPWGHRTNPPVDMAAKAAGTRKCSGCRIISGISMLLLIIAGFIFTNPVSSPAATPTISTQWGGYLRAIATRTYPDDQSIYQLVGNDALDDGQAELRLKNQTFLGSAWSLETHYELVIQQGDTLRKTGELRRILPETATDRILGAGAIDDSRRLMSLTRTFEDGDDRISYHRLDRLNLTYAGDWGSLRLGRQALTWGNGLIFNPMDLFNPFAPTSVQRDYKVGADMAYLQRPTGNGETQVLFVPRRNPETDELESDESSLAAKWHTNVKDLDLDLMAARHFHDHLLGMGATGYLGGAAWRLDAVYTRPHGDEPRNDFLQIVANLDYAWQWGGRNSYGLIEYYYNGLGRTGDYAQTLTDAALISRIVRGEIFTLGRNYLSSQLQYELHPLVQSFATVIINLDDLSFLIQPQLAWDVATNLQFIAGATLYSGEDDTEYGGFETTVPGATIRVAPSDSVYLWLTCYF